MVWQIESPQRGVQLDALVEMYLHLYLLESALHVLLKLLPRHPEYQLFIWFLLKTVSEEVVSHITEKKKCRKMVCLIS